MNVAPGFWKNADLIFAMEKTVPRDYSTSHGHSSGLATALIGRDNHICLNSHHLTELLLAVIYCGCLSQQSQLPDESFAGCNEYEFPKWLDPLVKFLWFLFTCQIIMCCLWVTHAPIKPYLTNLQMYFFWTNINYRRSIFRFKHESSHRKCHGPREVDHEIDVTDRTGSIHLLAKK